MAVVDNVKFELTGRFRELEVGKTHLSVRYESDIPLVRVGACLADYNWDNRVKVLEALLSFEASHDEFALEFDIIPLEAVVDAEYAEH